MHISGIDQKEYSLEIFTLQGQVVKQFETTSETEITLNLLSGIYISKLQLKNSNTV
ncbi:T9SS type A sorting domain-containing protein [Bacteroidota bacterium]